MAKNKLRSRQPFSNKSANEENQSKDIALKQFQIVSGIMSYEGGMYWTRSQHFLVANAALLGFVSTNAPSTDLQIISWARIYSVGVGGVGGLMLAYLWLLALKSGDYWVDHWKTVLISLEQSAFSEMNVYRPFISNFRYISAKRTAKKTNLLFIFLWIFLILYIGVCAVWKCLNWRLL